jgi:hypothetical protein
VGRTAPSLRMGVEGEIERLRRIFSSIEDPELRKVAMQRFSEIPLLRSC